MKCFFAFAVCAVILPAQESSSAAVPLHVWVLNTAEISDRTLARAEATAGYIFRKAGIAIEWVDCSRSDHPCRQKPQTSDFWLYILKQTPKQMEPDTAGYALLVPGCTGGCGYAAAAYPAALAFARHLHAEVSDVLGAAVAHELGHLLLGSRAHEPGGVMASRLRPPQIASAARGSLFFSAQQGVQMRGRLAKLSSP